MIDVIIVGLFCCPSSFRPNRPVLLLQLNASRQNKTGKIRRRAYYNQVNQSKLTRQNVGESIFILLPRGNHRKSRHPIREFLGKQKVGKLKVIPAGCLFNCVWMTEAICRCSQWEFYATFRFMET